MKIMARSKRHGHVLFVTVLLVITLALIAVGALIRLRASDGRAAKQDQKLSSIDSAPVEVRASKIQRRKLEVRADFHGFLMPFVELSVSAQVAGQIIEQLVEVSDTVKKGQRLYKIDDAVRLIDQEQALANLERLTSDFELASAHRDRIQRMDQQQSTSMERTESKARVLSAQANKRNAEANLQRSRLQLERCVVLSPLDGVVSRVHVRRGEFSQAGQALIDVIEIDRLKLLVELEDQEVVWLKVGQPAILTTHTFPGERFEGTVQRIFPQALPTSRKFEVEIELPNPQRKLRPGFFMKGFIQKPLERDDSLDADGILIIPREAVVEFFGIKFCYVVHSQGHDGDTEDATLIARRSPVVVYPLASNPRVFRLVQGAKEGDLVVTKGLQHLSEETRIHITN